MNTNRSNAGALIGGTLLIAFGLLSLAGQFIRGVDWGALWPFIIIVIGALFFIAMFSGGKSTAGFAVPGSIVGGIGLVLLFQNITGHWESMAYFWTLIIMFVGVGIYIMGWYGTLKDFAAVVQVGQSPLLVAVHPSMPVRSIKELIALARARPGQVTFGTGGIGSTAHMSMEWFKVMAKVDILPVHYKGEGPAIIETVGGHVQMLAASIAVLQPYAGSGKLRGLPVTTTKRSALAPEYPTIAESGLKGYDTTSWQGIVVPAATLRDVVQKLNTETVYVLSQPAARDQFLKLGVEIVQ